MQNDVGSPDFALRISELNSPTVMLFGLPCAQRLPKIIAASEYATHTSSNTNILKRRDPKQREFTRYFKEIVRARISAVRVRYAQPRSRVFTITVTPPSRTTLRHTPAQTRILLERRRPAQRLPGSAGRTWCRAGCSPGSSAGRGRRLRSIAFLAMAPSASSARNERKIAGAIFGVLGPRRWHFYSAAGRWSGWPEEKVRRAGGQTSAGYARRIGCRITGLAAWDLGRSPRSDGLIHRAKFDGPTTSNRAARSTASRARLARSDAARSSGASFRLQIRECAPPWSARPATPQPGQRSVFSEYRIRPSRQCGGSFLKASTWVA